jgi:sulfonate transport system permease protein
VPLFILWFGIFEASKIILIAVGVFFPVYLGVMGTVGRPQIVEVGRAFRSAAVVRQILAGCRASLCHLAPRRVGAGLMFVAAGYLGA